MSINEEDKYEITASAITQLTVKNIIKKDLSRVPQNIIDTINSKIYEKARAGETYITISKRDWQNILLKIEDEEFKSCGKRGSCDTITTYMRAIWVYYSIRGFKITRDYSDMLIHWDRNEHPDYELFQEAYNQSKIMWDCFLKY